MTGDGGPVPDGRPWIGIGASGALLAAYAAVEDRLFEVLGGFAAAEAVPEAAVLFDALSQQHAWHAGLFAEQVPLVPGTPPPGAPAAGAPAAATLDRLAGLEGAPARLAGLARVVLPRAVAGYRRHLGAVRAPPDAPVARALRLVVRDEVEALLGAEALLEALLGADGEAPALDAAWALEEPLLAGGPGLVPWPGPETAPAGR
ncbi:MAG: hypothetical protein KGJ77_01760 [Acidobacteriota bacterium]|nr:hypothetical protein [Acidobacteriota bacterium]